jgi:hypothetical protein
MANLDELVKAIGDKNSSGLQIAGGILGTLADISGAIGFVQLGSRESDGV